MKRVTLKKNEEQRIKRGHLWVFSNEILSFDDSINNGETVEIYDSRENFLAAGFYNSNSLIAVRILSKEKFVNLSKLIKERIRSAYNFRKKIYPNRNSYRIIFSESDLLPGLIIDKYNDTYVLQVNSIGMEKNIDIILDTLINELKAKKIISMNDEYFRKLEGLQTDNKIIFESEEASATETISDGFINYEINFEKGQKTGFYFDQCDNRENFGKFCKGKTVLDCFCNSGGFGLHAAYNGASSITFVDSSHNEIENAKKNFTLNNFSNDSCFIVNDVFDYLGKCISEGKKFDVVNIDPPAFAKSRKSIPAAIKGYEKLNRLAIAVLNKGGFLFSSSCSHHINKSTFLEVINKAAQKSGRDFQLNYFNSASLDHPSLPSMEETSYLKFAMLREIL